MSLENLTGLMTAAVKPYRKAPNAPDISCRPAKLLGTFFLAAATAMAATACVSAATLPLPAATATVMAASVPVVPTMPVAAVVEVMSTAPASTDVDAAAVDRRISVIVRRRVACFVGVGVSVGVGISVARRDGTAA